MRLCLPSGGGEIIFAQPKSLQMFDPLQHFHLCMFINMQSRDSWNCTCCSSASWTWCHMKLLTSLNYLPHSKFLLLTLHWPPGGRSCQAQMLLFCCFFCILRRWREQSRLHYRIIPEFSTPTFSRLSVPSPDSGTSSNWQLIFSAVFFLLLVSDFVPDSNTLKCTVNFFLGRKNKCQLS